MLSTLPSNVAIGGQVPLTALQGGMAYAGGAPTLVPVMYATQGTPGMLYQVSAVIYLPAGSQLI